MAFSQSEISGVDVRADGPELLISWTSSAPEGTTFQVYVDHRLTWCGTSRRCHVPIPAGAAGRNVWVDVGTVGPGEDLLDSSGNLLSRGGGGAVVRLSWLGGAYLDPSGLGGVEGFRIYRGPSPGAPIDWSVPVGEVTAYPGGRVGDGFGLGGFGLGGFGSSATLYEWSAEGLATGSWQFAVVPFDKAGNNRGSGRAVTVTAANAPLPPARLPSGKRLTYSYSGPATRVVTLNWLSSP